MSVRMPLKLQSSITAWWSWCKWRGLYRENCVVMWWLLYTKWVDRCLHVWVHMPYMSLPTPLNFCNLQQNRFAYSRQTILYLETYLLLTYLICAPKFKCDLWIHIYVCHCTITVDMISFCSQVEFLCYASLGVIPFGLARSHAWPHGQLHVEAMNRDIHWSHVVWAWRCISTTKVLALVPSSGVIGIESFDSELTSIEHWSGILLEISHAPWPLLSPPRKGGSSQVVERHFLPLRAVSSLTQLQKCCCFDRRPQSQMEVD